MTDLRTAAQQAEPVQEPVAFDTAHAMRLADEYADLAADVRAAQGYPEHALAQDRKRMDEARASLAAYLSRQAEPDAYGYASRLAVAIWEKHYKDAAPQWKPLDDLMGVLTQIDNMTSGLPRLAQQAEPVAKQARLPLPGQIAALKAERDALLNILLRARDAIETLDGTSVENEKLVDEYRAVIARAGKESS